MLRPRRSTLFPYTTLFRSAFEPPFLGRHGRAGGQARPGDMRTFADQRHEPRQRRHPVERLVAVGIRSEEHTSELQSRENLVCRLLLEKKNSTNYDATSIHM